MASVISFIVYESYIYWLYHELWINFVSASIKGQPLYKGQMARSQCVRYSEVPLYYSCLLTPIQFKFIREKKQYIIQGVCTYCHAIHACLNYASGTFHDVT